MLSPLAEVLLIQHNQTIFNEEIFKYENRQSFSEQDVDGYLLLATTDSELQWTLGMFSVNVYALIS